MFGVEISQWTAFKRQRGSRNGQEGQPAPLSRASWSSMFDTGLKFCAVPSLTYIIPS